MFEITDRQAEDEPGIELSAAEAPAEQVEPDELIFMPGIDEPVSSDAHLQSQADAVAQEIEWTDYERGIRSRP